MKTEIVFQQHGDCSPHTSITRVIGEYYTHIISVIEYIINYIYTLFKKKKKYINFLLLNLKISILYKTIIVNKIK